MMNMTDLTQEDLIYTARNASDWKDRSEAVLKITDEEVLKDIFAKDSIVMVKIKAVCNINDTDFLRDECLNNPQSHVRYTILNRILDEKLLEGDELNLLLTHLTLNDPEVTVSQMACRNLSADNHDVFVEAVASNRDDDLRREATSKIADADILNDLALHDSNRFVRLEAISNPNMESLYTLIEAIKNDENEFNRYSAILKLENLNLLNKVIFNTSLYHRLAEISQSVSFSLSDYFEERFKHLLLEYQIIVAVNFIADESILDSIVESSENEVITVNAINNRHFKNQRILHNLFKYDAHPDVILAAADKVDDETLIIDYIKQHSSDTDLTSKLIFKIKDIDFLRQLLESEESQISKSAARQLIKLKYYLLDIAMNYPAKEIRLEAISQITDKHDLVMIAHESDGPDIAIAALNNMVAEKLIRRYLPSRSIITDSFNEIAFRSRLDDLALSRDKEIQLLAISKLNRKEKLDIIIETEKDCEIIDAAEKRLDTLWEDIKLIDDENVLRVIADKGDEDIKVAVQAQIEDLMTWRDRISKINDITDISQLKYIANNDYNYYVRCEAEGKLENLLFNVRLDEIKFPKNQERFKSIARDETYPSQIRKRAFSNVYDENFKC